MMEVAGQLLLVLIALVVVIGLIFAAAWAVRRYGGAALLGAGSQIRTLATTNVGQRERVLLLEVNGVQLLVGVASGGVSLLREFAITPAPTASAALSSTPTPLQDVRALPSSENVLSSDSAALRFKDTFAIALKRALGRPSA